jgi:NAD+ synthase
MLNLPPIDPATESERLITFIKKAFADSKFSTAVIGLSGGIDSSVSFALTVKALGTDRVHAYHLPSKTTPPQHHKDLQQLTSDLGLQTDHFHLIPISGLIQKTWRTIHRHSKLESKNQQDKKRSQETNKLRLANLAARIRMSLLFDAAKKHNALVIGTENKSESLLGYFTRFGDAASDLEPITHLYKTHVYQLANHLQLPESIIQKNPSADLWKDQTDETELGFSYAKADPILYAYSNNQSSQSIIEAGADPALVEKVFARIAQTDFKHHVPYTPKP